MQAEAEASACIRIPHHPAEMHAILTEILACFLPSRAKDLSAPLLLSFCFILSLSQIKVFDAISSSKLSSTFGADCLVLPYVIFSAFPPFSFW